MKKTLNGAGVRRDGYCEGCSNFKRVKYETEVKLWLCAKCTLSPTGLKALSLLDLLRAVDDG